MTARQEESCLAITDKSFIIHIIPNRYHLCLIRLLSIIWLFSFHSLSFSYFASICLIIQMPHTLLDMFL